jgi:hypothetical protein
MERKPALGVDIMNILKGEFLNGSPIPTLNIISHPGKLGLWFNDRCLSTARTLLGANTGSGKNRFIREALPEGPTDNVGFKLRCAKPHGGSGPGENKLKTFKIQVPIQIGGPPGFPSFNKTTRRTGDDQKRQIEEGGKLFTPGKGVLPLDTAEVAMDKNPLLARVSDLIKIGIERNCQRRGVLTATDTNGDRGTG